VRSDAQDRVVTPWEDSKFRAPHQAVSEVTFDRVAYPPLRLYLAYFESHTLCSSLHCVRALDLVPSPTRTLTKPSPQSRRPPRVEGIRLPLATEPQRRCRLQIVGHGHELLLLAEVDLVHRDLSQGKSLSTPPPSEPENRDQCLAPCSPDRPN
jgi:hypothetical protein